MAIIGVQPPFSSKNSATKSQSPTSYRRCWLLWMEEGFWHNWFWVSIHCFSVALKQFSTCNMYWGAPRLPPTSSAALPNEYQKTGWGWEGNFYNLSFNWFSDKFIEFFYKKFMGLKQMWLAGVWGRVGVFYIYLILFETFLAPDLCSQLLINSSYRRNHQKRLLQTVWS